MAMCTTWRRCHKTSQAERKRETPYFIPDLVFWWHALVDLLGELDELDFVSTSVRCSLPFDAVAGASSAPGAPPLGYLRQGGTVSFVERRGEDRVGRHQQKKGRNPSQYLVYHTASSSAIDRSEVSLTRLPFQEAKNNIGSFGRWRFVTDTKCR